MQAAGSLPWKNPSMDFSKDCRIALQFCMLLSRPPWLDIDWQDRAILHTVLEEFFSIY